MSNSIPINILKAPYDLDKETLDQHERTKT